MLKRGKATPDPQGKTELIGNTGNAAPPDLSEESRDLLSFFQSHPEHTAVLDRLQDGFHDWNAENVSGEGVDAEPENHGEPNGNDHNGCVRLFGDLGEQSNVFYLLDSIADSGLEECPQWVWHWGSLLQRQVSQLGRQIEQEEERHGVVPGTSSYSEIINDIYSLFDRCQVRGQDAKLLFKQGTKLNVATFRANLPKIKERLLQAWVIQLLPESARTAEMRRQLEEERAKVTELEEKNTENAPLIERAKAEIESSKRGHDKAYGTEDEREEKKSIYKAKAEEIRGSNKALSYTEVCKRVGETFNVAGKTIQRAWSKNDYESMN